MVNTFQLQNYSDDDRMLRETPDNTEKNSERMDGREEEESIGSSKDDEIPNGNFSTTTSETDDIAATTSVKSEVDLDEKPFTTPGSSTHSDTQSSTSETHPVQSTLPPSSSRLMRNLAEKMRRDKLNTYISELSSLVPIVAMATKRMDKTSVLRLSANFLRIHLSLKQATRKKESSGGSSSSSSSSSNVVAKLAPEGLQSTLSATLLEALEGFMLIVTSSGKIVFVSDSVEKLLGHSQLDLMGQSLYTICHNGDHELLRHHLQPSSFDSKGAEDASETPSADYVPRSPSFFGGKPEDALSGLASGERRSFYCRLAERSMARGDPARHVTVHLIGILRPPLHKKDAPKTTTKGKKEHCSSTTSNDEYLLVCVARPFRNKGITELSLMEAVQDEYVTRHLPDGRIIYSDHRIAFVAGYLTEEVMGMSAFNFIHQDDLPWATVANRQMFSSVDGQGYTVYRLRSKTGTLIHLRTRGYLEFNKTTQKVETFVCINTLLTPEEGDKELEKERERITPFITFQQVTTTTSTNSSSVAGGSAQSLTQGSTKALTSSHQSTVPATSKTITSLTTTTLLSRKEKPVATARAPTILPTSSVVDVVELDPEDSEDILSPDLKPEVPVELHMNGNSMTSSHTESVASISPPPSATTTTSEFVIVTEPLLDHVGQDVLRLSPTTLTSTSRITDTHIRGTAGKVLPRLKRSLPDVDDDPCLLSSAKRSINGPNAFHNITPYSPLHHSQHLGTKWGAETTATIIFDQHNNNG